MLVNMGDLPCPDNDVLSETIFVGTNSTTINNNQQDVKSVRSITATNFAVVKEEHKTININNDSSHHSSQSSNPRTSSVIQDSANINESIFHSFSNNDNVNISNNSLNINGIREGNEISYEGKNNGDESFLANNPKKNVKILKNTTGDD
jgi:hypothetical protein